MPRKAGEFKGSVLRVEGLSEPGKAITDPAPTAFIDDFTGEAVPVVTPEPMAAKPAPDHRELARLAKVEEAKIGLSMLVRTGVVKDQTDPIPLPPRPKVELIPKGQRKIAEINGKAVLVPLQPWRRF